MDDYYNWLIDKIGNRNSVVLKTLYDIPYRYSIPLDENRLNAGLNLRQTFSFDRGVDAIVDRPVSVLEVLISLAIAMEDNTSIPKEHWFWEMMENLKLRYSNNPNDILESIDRWLDHNYSYDGVGSVFPLVKAPMDTRTIQLWDHMALYINEKYGRVNYLQ